MTIMTTRTQGGSVIDSRRIELMQARRLIFDDKAAKEVILNETEATRTLYYMQLFNRDFEKPV